MKKTATLVTILISLSFRGISGNENYFFQDITKKYDLTFGPVNTLSEDDNGFLWFGCDNGLYYSNNSSIKKIKLYNNDNKNSHSIKIYNIYKDNKGIQWVCSQDGLFKHNIKTNTFEQIKLLKPNRRILENTPITDILQVSETEYIINTTTKAYRYQLYNATLEPYIINNGANVDRIAHMHRDENGSIVFGTTDGRIFVTPNIDTKAKLLYTSEKNLISSICKDGNKYIVGYHENGIEVISLDGKKIYEINESETGKNHIESNDIRKIIRKENGEIWIATHLGLVILGYDTQTSWGFDPQRGLPHRSIFSLEQGKDGGVWIGTWAGGVAYYKPCNYKFKTVEIDYNRKPAKNVVSGFAEDKNGIIWVGSDEEGGLRYYNPETHNFIHHPLEKELSQIKKIKSLAIIDNIVAIGTFKNGLFLYDTKRKEQINTPIAKNVDILSIKGNKRNVFIAQRRTVFQYDIQKQTFEKTFSYNEDGRIWYLYLDSSHNLWICTDNGLYLKPKGTHIFRECFTTNSKYDLDKESIYSICEDKNGDMWIGTKGKGIFIYSLYEDILKKAPDYELTKDADIYSIISDQEKNTWYYANEGLYCYNAVDKNTSYFNDIDGLPNEHLAPNTAFLSKSGKLFLGSVNAFNIIDPSIIKKNTTAPRVFISDIEINNEPLSENNIISANSMSTKEISDLTLNHKQNTLLFKVVTNNFIKSAKNKFKYRLINYDDEWLEISAAQDIIFTKIPSGSYTLEVLGSNNDKVWSKTPYQLKIKILPPYWRRWYSLIIYFIISLTIGYVIIKEIRSKIKLQKEISKERYKSQASELMHNERVRFFTNISHELRTPLTLILSPINNLVTMLAGDEKAQNLLNVLERNTQRLLRLTNQTLDFRLLEVGKLEPKFAKIDIVQLCTEVYHCFEQQILDKEIKFKFTSNFKELDMLIDGDMIEKVIYNLISNSLKYTDNNGNLFLSIEKKVMTDESYKGYIRSGDIFYGEAVEVILRDTGIGIKAELLPHIFERFSKGSEEHKGSSGIGLHLCTEYTKLNNGNILLTSNEGIGSTFILNLPIQDAAIIEKHKNIEQQIITQTIEKETETVEEIIAEHNKSKHKTVLLVEDNNELRSYLKTFLSTFFRIVTAKDGQQAIKILNEVRLDLVITDISMPHVSGLELLDILKANDETKHIPVIVLTAFTEKQYQKESILKGADSFLTKPIDDSILLAQINNVFQRMEVYQTSKATDKKNSDKNTTFIESIEQIIEKNLQNQKFSLNDILSELNISKSTLDRKLKQQANQNPSGLIRDVRLKNAIKLMRTNKFNIDEIATYVGFNSSSYFIRSFKAKYGQTPREYRENHKD